jgi:Protein of unknown function (DUF760)
MSRNLLMKFGLSVVAAGFSLHVDSDAFNINGITSTLNVQNRVQFMGLRSSIGDGGDEPPFKSGSENQQGWEDFLNRNENESENLIRAREYLSDNSLPISYGQVSDTNVIKNENEISNSELKIVASNSSALVANSVQPSPFPGGLTPEALSQNPYLAVVTRLSPSDIISKFTSTAPPGVQNAVRSTILGLIGGLPKMAFETTTVTTGQKLASLMFQLQMTGYMFKVRLFTM